VRQQAIHAVLGHQRGLAAFLTFDGQPDERSHAEREHLALQQFLLGVLHAEEREQPIGRCHGEVVRAHVAMVAPRLTHR